MKKIPTLFKRDPDNMARVLPEFAVTLPEGAVADRKWDGTACLIRDGKLYARHTLRSGKTPPPGFEPATDVDPITGKQEGWKPVTDAPEFKHYPDHAGLPDGTYELVGPKVQGNPERQPEHVYVPHGAWNVSLGYGGASAADMYETLERELADVDYEGFVWWHAGEPVAKIKRRDFGLPWPVKEEG